MCYWRIIHIVPNASCDDGTYTYSFNSARGKSVCTRAAINISNSCMPPEYLYAYNIHTYIYICTTYTYIHIYFIYKCRKQSYNMVHRLE